MSAVIDLLLPPRCLACAARGLEPLCQACQGQLEPDREGHELAPGVIAVACWVYAGPIAAAIKRVKSGALRAGARGLATMLAPALPPTTPCTWVPAPPSRRRRRGLDLPEILAGPSAVAMLRNTRHRRDQPELDAAGRRAAAVGAYTACGSSPPAVVLVDDVRATGATLLAAATALQQAGARRVLALTLAASPGPPSATRPGLHPATRQDQGSTAVSGRWSSRHRA